jgi:hypothetical protein
MANTIIDTFDTMFSRLVDAAQESMPLAGVSVVIGTPGATFTPETLPAIELVPTKLGKSDEKGMGGLTSFEITIYMRLREDKEFGLYNEDRTRGLLWLLENACNAIDGTDGAGGGTWYGPPEYNFSDFTSSETLLMLDVEVKLRSKMFRKGGM